MTDLVIKALDQPTPPRTAGIPPTPPRRVRLRRLGPGRRIPYGRVLGPLLVLAIWSASSALRLLDPRVLPEPWTVVATAGDLISTGRLQSNLLTSLQRAGFGFVFGLGAGTVLALAAGL